MRDRSFFLGILLAIAAVAGVYSNHFQNSFHFDDFHTINNNPFVRELKNIPLFFSDPRTFSIFPGHQSYRPLLTTSVAIDYWLAKGYLPVYFHASTFAWFLLQLALIYALFVTLMDKAQPLPPESRNRHRWFALFAATLYGLHPAVAETVNYIVQRAEIQSTAGVLAGLVLYIRFPHLRRFGLYLVPVVIGMMAKAPAAVFAGILFAYVLLFEENGNLWRAAVASFPAFAVCGIAGAFVMYKEASTFVAGGADPLLYRLTQPSAIWYYFRTMFWPSGLSADTDFSTVSGVDDPRVILGTIFVAALCGLLWWSASRPGTRLIALGIAWFLMALAPTSWVPLTEVVNDHRMFFPFVGLTLAVVWAIQLYGGQDYRSLTVSAAVILLACAFATHQRNEIWRTEESLWRDVTIKSPLNGRGHMNYGLTQMEKGDYNAALRSFDEALRYTPNYSLLHINIGIAKSSLGQDSDAEQQFRQALALAPGDSQSYSYYAKFLAARNRTADAIAMLKTAARISPLDPDSRKQLLDLYATQHDWNRLDPLLAESLRLWPNDPALLHYQTIRATAGSANPAQSASAPSPRALTPDGFLELSLALYQAGRYADCITAAQKALALKADYPEAYNNIAAAYNAMKQYDEGIRAAEQALRLKPDFTLARNNLAWAQSQKQVAK